VLPRSFGKAELKLWLDIMYFYEETSELTENAISYQLATDKRLIFTKQLEATNCELLYG
jgi:hypothetical protein